MTAPTDNLLDAARSGDEAGCSDEMLEVEDGYASPDASYEEREAVEVFLRTKPLSGENAPSVLARRDHPGGRPDQGSDCFRRPTG